MLCVDHVVGVLQGGPGRGRSGELDPHWRAQSQAPWDTLQEVSLIAIQ